MSAALKASIRQLKAAIEAATPQASDVSDIVKWSEKAAGFELDQWQKDVLLSQAKRQILLCSRQSGKSTVSALLGALIAARGGRVIVIGPSLRQSASLFRMLHAYLLNGGCRLIRETATEIEVAGGGYATCLPGDRPSMLRGASLRSEKESALIIDEAAFTKSELWPTATPMLAAAGETAKLILLSTPAGPVGEFYRVWEEEETFEKITVRAVDCPRISPAFLEEEKRRLGVLYEQEYCGKFISAGNSVFSAEAISAMFAEPVEGIEAGAPVWEAMLSGDEEKTATPKVRMWSF